MVHSEAESGVRCSTKNRHIYSKYSQYVQANTAPASTTGVRQYSYFTSSNMDLNAGCSQLRIHS